LRNDPNTPARLQRRAREREREALEVLESWVSVNSYTRNRAGVEEMGARIAERFAPLGFHERIAPSGGDELGDHRVLSRAGGGPHVVLISHLDTVYPPDEQLANAFDWREAGDWVIGPGVADIKGGTLVCWLAVSLLAEQRPELFEDIGWSLLLNASEEEGSATFPELLRETVTATPGTAAALVFEHATEGQGRTTSRVTVSRRGSGRFRLDAGGRAAHSGSAHAEGISALRQLAREIEQIEGWTDPGRGLTFNVGLARGGSAINTVPERASAWIDMRADSPEVFEEGARRVLARSGPGDVVSTSDGASAETKVTRLPDYPPWPRNEGSDTLARLAGDAAAALGLRVEPEHRLGASDGCHVWDLVPTLDGLGPIGRNIHCAVDDPDSGRRPERARIASIPERAALVALLIERIATTAGQG
jgi:glutamate carboxypeptidase